MNFFNHSHAVLLNTLTQILGESIAIHSYLFTFPPWTTRLTINFSSILNRYSYFRFISLYVVSLIVFLQFRCNICKFTTQTMCNCLLLDAQLECRHMTNSFLYHNFKWWIQYLYFASGIFKIHDVSCYYIKSSYVGLHFSIVCKSIITQISLTLSKIIVSLEWHLSINYIFTNMFYHSDYYRCWHSKCIVLVQCLFWYDFNLNCNRIW